MLVSLRACRRLYPGGTADPCHWPAWCRLRDPTAAAFPFPSQGRLPHLLFRGLNGVSPVFRPACSRSCQAALSVESFSRLVARAAVSTATGCNDYFPGGTLTRW